MNAENNRRCHYCGGDAFKQETVEYLYSRDGQRLLVPDMPAEVCQTCGMVYYSGPALLEAERRFQCIQQRQEWPDRWEILAVSAVTHPEGN